MRRQDATGSKREGEESPPKEKVKILLSKQVPPTLTVLEPFKFENRTADTATMARMFRLERRETRRNSNFEEGEGGWMLAAGVQLCNLQGVFKSGLGGPSLTVHSAAYNPPLPTPPTPRGWEKEEEKTETKHKHCHHWFAWRRCCCHFYLPLSPLAVRTHLKEGKILIS